MALIQTNPKRRRYGVAALAGVLGGIVSAIVKFGWEVPLPPRTPERNATNPPQELLQQLGAPESITHLSYSFNGNFAQEGGKSIASDALVVESPEGNPAVNVLVWKSGTDKSEAIAKLEKILHSEQVKKYIQETWSDGSVIPAF